MMMLKGKFLSHRWHEFPTDRINILFILLFASAIAIFVIRSNIVSPQFYQGEYSPAISYACGFEFLNLHVGQPIIEGNDFLQVKQQDFECRLIPALHQYQELNSFQASSRYLLLSAAYTWRVLGVSWGNLWPLYALFYSASCVLAYGILRLANRPGISLLFAIFFCLLPFHFTNLPHLRDYSKAPFILAIIAGIGWAIVSGLDKKNYLLLSATLGAIVGVGMGFRGDLLLFVPAVLMALAFFVKTPTSSFVRTRLLGMAIFLFVFVLCSFPILQAMSGGGNLFHVILLGLTQPFDFALGLTASPVYEIGYLYNDSYIYGLTVGGAGLVLDNYLSGLGTYQYSEAGRQLYFEIIKNFPADIVTRFLASIIKILQLNITSRLSWANSFQSFAEFVSLAAAFVCIVVLALRNLRLALIVCACVMFLAAYPAFQFHGRHFFFLQIIPLFFIATLLSGVSGYFFQKQIGEAGIACDHEGVKKSINNDKIFRNFLSFLLIIILGCGGFWALRVYQSYAVSNMIDTVESMPRENVKFTKIKNLDDSIRLLPIEVGDIDSSERMLNYWRLEWGGCRSDYLPVRIVYNSKDAFHNFSRDLVLEKNESNIYYFHTIEFRGLNEFVGLDVNPEDFQCIRRLSKIDRAQDVNLYPNLRLGIDWKGKALYQKFGVTDQNLPSASVGIAEAFFPHDLQLSKGKVDDLLAATKISNIDNGWRKFDDTVKWEEGSVRVQGRAPTPYAYALQAEPMQSDGHRYAIVSGRVRGGGLTVGLISGGQWAAQINQDRLGKFRFIFKPPPGIYQLTVAHNVPKGPENDFVLDHLGWASELGDDD